MFSALCNTSLAMFADNFRKGLGEPTPTSHSNPQNDQTRLRTRGNNLAFANTPGIGQLSDAPDVLRTPPWPPHGYIYLSRPPGLKMRPVCWARSRAFFLFSEISLLPFLARNTHSRLGIENEPLSLISCYGMPHSMPWRIDINSTLYAANVIQVLICPACNLNQNIYRICPKSALESTIFLKMHGAKAAFLSSTNENGISNENGHYSNGNGVLGMFESATWPAVTEMSYLLGLREIAKENFYVSDRITWRWERLAYHRRRGVVNQLQSPNPTTSGSLHLL